MAYGFHVSPGARSEVDGKSYISWTITETEAVTASEWVIESVPQFFTITLFEIATRDAPVGTSGYTPAYVNPRLGTASPWTENSIDHVVANLKARQAVRNGCSVRVNSPNSRLYGCSTPTSHAGATIVAGAPAYNIVTRITIVEGH